MKISRRDFTMLGVTSLVGTAAGRIGLRYPRALLETALLSDCTINVPAPLMKERVDKFRSSFIRDYLQPKPNPPYPIYEAMYRGSALPSTKAAVKALGERDYFKIQRPHPQTPANPNSFRLTNEGTSAFDAPFIALMSGQELRLRINFPKKFEIAGVYDATSVTFNLKPQILMVLTDLPTDPDGNVVNVERRQNIVSVKVAETGIEYEFRAASNPANRLKVKLDFRDSSKYEVQCSNRTRLRALWNALAGFGLIGLLPLLSLFGCNNRVNHPEKNCPDPQTLAHVTRCCEQDTKGLLVEGGVMYVRVRHETAHGDQCQDQQNIENLCTYVRADQLPENCMLKICAEVEEFPMSYTESDPKREVDGCDYRYIANIPSARNVKYVTKCSPMSIVPTTAVVASGVQFQQQLTLTGGSNPRYKLLPGAPPWLQLSLTGLLKGTPPAAGEYHFTVSVATNEPCKGSILFDLRAQ